MGLERGFKTKNFEVKGLDYRPLKPLSSSHLQIQKNMIWFYFFLCRSLDSPSHPKTPKKKTREFPLGGPSPCGKQDKPPVGNVLFLLFFIHSLVIISQLFFISAFFLVFLFSLFILCFFVFFLCRAVHWAIFMNTCNLEKMNFALGQTCETFKNWNIQGAKTILDLWLFYLLGFSS